VGELGELRPTYAAGPHITHSDRGKKEWTTKPRLVYERPVKRCRTRWTVLAGIVLVVAAIIPLLPYIEMRYFYRNPGQSAREQLNPWRRKLMRPQRVVEAMRLQPGMTVLDLGSGYGFFTFLLAQAVGNGGRVFATDCTPDAAKSLASQASQMGVKNVTPVVVQQCGLDAFYKTHTFDAVLACDVVAYLGDAAEQRAFLSELGRSLKPNGRLWVLTNRLDADFDVTEFEDWSVTTEALRSPGAQSLLAKRLRPQVRAALAAGPSALAAESCRRLLVEDLNRLLEDSTFWPEITREFQPPESYLNPRYEPPRRYLLRKLEQTEGFTWTSQKVPERARPLLRLLNRLVIQDLLETVVFEKAFHLDQYEMKNWQYMSDGLLRLSETVPLIEKAGYQLVQEHKILTSHLICEFRHTPH